MFSFIAGIDTTITKYLIDIVPRSLALDVFFSFLSVQGLTVIIWLIVLFFYISWEEYHHRKFTLYFLLSFGITTFFVEFIFKNIVQRLRPWEVWHLAQGGCPATYSFPSGHAAGAFSGAVIFAYFDPKRKYLYYAIAALISFSRIYLYCHFFLDIVFGAIVGYAFGKILLTTKKRKAKVHKKDSLK